MHRSLPLWGLTVLVACGAPSQNTAPAPPAIGADGRVGVLVMAHGGGADWDRAVAEALAPVRRAAPTVLALGMAEAPAVRAALDSLRAIGVDRVVVVRLFLSGQSFLRETRALLGLGPSVASAHGAPLDALVPSDLAVATHQLGLLDSPLTTDVLVERVVSEATPPGESLMLVAHGMADEEANNAVLGAMGTAAARLRRHGFSRIELVTLREDWPEERARSEAQMRAFVSSQTRAGRHVLVVPVRLFGFGPYGQVLQGLDYATTPALLPHPAVSDWILQTADAIACQEAWPPPTGTCPVE